MTTTPKNTNHELQIMRITQDRMMVAILGRTPLILNKLSNKVRMELLMPAGKKNAAAKASTLKHNPHEEFRNSAHTLPGGPTLLALPATAFKGAMRTAALDIPGATKSAIGRLVYVAGEYVPIYGVPQLHMTITRSADIKRTPDVRTRCIIPNWAAYITVEFTTPLIKGPSILNLLAAAGLSCGVGDWRVEKGSGSFGTFSPVGHDAAFDEIIKLGGREAQVAAMASPEAYDSETQELLSWFDVEVDRRGFKVA